MKKFIFIVGAVAAGKTTFMEKRFITLIKINVIFLTTTKQN